MHGDDPSPGGGNPNSRSRLDRAEPWQQEAAQKQIEKQRQQREALQQQIAEKQAMDGGGTPQHSQYNLRPAQKYSQPPQGEYHEPPQAGPNGHHNSNEESAYGAGPPQRQPPHQQYQQAPQQQYRQRPPPQHQQYDDSFQQPPPHARSNDYQNTGGQPQDFGNSQSWSDTGGSFEPPPQLPGLALGGGQGHRQDGGASGGDADADVDSAGYAEILGMMRDLKAQNAEMREQVRL